LKEFQETTQRTSQLR